jgi:dihydrofolate reductase
MGLTMPNVVFFMSISVDGFFEGPNHELDWQIVDEELHTHFNAVMREAGAFFDGRVTYELMRSHWPTRDQDPDASQPEKEFAGIWRDMPKYVFSRSLRQAEWNTTILREVEPEQIQQLKREPGGDLFIGGANLLQSFLRENLVDQFRLYVHPVVLGRGRRLFAEAEKPQDLRLVETRTFSSGVVLLRYAVVR